MLEWIQRLRCPLEGEQTRTTRSWQSRLHAEARNKLLEPNRIMVDAPTTRAASNVSPPPHFVFQPVRVYANDNSGSLRSHVCQRLRSLLCANYLNLDLDQSRCSNRFAPTVLT